MNITHPNGWRKFIAICQNLKDDKALDSMLKLLLTMEEQQQIATRVLLIEELLKKEKPQRQIAEELKVSIAKITRGSNALKHLSDEELLELSKEFLT